jgi:hypothetical protein
LVNRAVPPRRSAERRGGRSRGGVLLRREVFRVVEHRSRSRGIGGKRPRPGAPASSPIVRRPGLVATEHPRSGSPQRIGVNGRSHTRVAHRVRAVGRESSCCPGSAPQGVGPGKDRGADRRECCLVGRGRSNTAAGRKPLIRRPPAPFVDARRRASRRVTRVCVNGARALEAKAACAVFG